MKMVKSLVLGSAAGLNRHERGAGGLIFPSRPKRSEYVRICSLYGAGFFYIPGTDTCIKLGGYLRVDNNVQRQRRSGQSLAWNGDSGQVNRYRDYFITRSRIALTVDNPHCDRILRRRPYLRPGRLHTFDKPWRLA